jgi:PKD repeat protein
VNTTSGTAPLTVYFTGQYSSDSDGSIVSYAWNLGNGQTSSSINPATTYSAAGTYTAILTVTDNDGLQGSASVTVNVSAPVATNNPPVAVASSTSATTGVAPLTIQFNGSSSYDPEGSGLSYAWNFGDGYTSSAISPAHTYSAGSYTARLTVTDDKGASASATIAVSVQSAVKTSNMRFDVTDYSLQPSRAPHGTSAAGYVQLRDEQGGAVAGATITIRWSGVVSGNSTVVTDSTGHAQVSSKGTKRSGTITGTITGVSSATGDIFDSTLWSGAMSSSVTTP